MLRGSPGASELEEEFIPWKLPRPNSPPGHGLVKISTKNRRVPRVRDLLKKLTSVENSMSGRVGDRRSLALG